MTMGRLILVVGPSGVGKDSLLDTAKEYLSDDDRVIFARRYITRNEDAGGEDHREISPADFDRKLANGDFSLHWQAHGHQYGISASTLRDVKSGHTVVVNGSRGIVEAAREIYPALSVASITTQPDILRKRLQNRGRESDTEIEARIERATALKISGPDITEIDNSGPLEIAAQKFVKLITQKSLVGVR